MKNVCYQTGTQKVHKKIPKEGLKLVHKFKNFVSVKKFKMCAWNQNFGMSMDDTLEHMKEILRQKMTVNIYSIPNFSFEIFISLAICVIYGILQSQIGDVRLRKIQFKPALSEIYRNKMKNSPNDSKESLAAWKQFTNEPQIAKKSEKSADQIVTCCGDACAACEHYDKLERFLSLTPNQFVEMDKERKNSERIRQYTQSLAALYTTAVQRKLSDASIKKHIELAKEHLELAKLTSTNFKVDRITSSLFELLERIICNTSPKKPFPFRGDIAVLAMDMANLSMDSDPLDIESALPPNASKTQNEKFHNSQSYQKKEFSV